MRNHSQLSRDAIRRFHRIVGNYLAIYAWQHDADCIRISGHCLKWVLGLQRLRADSSKYFRDDIQSWFPFAYPMWKSTPGVSGKASKSLRQMYVSRVPIEFTKGTPVTEVRVVDFRPEGWTALTEESMLTQLTLFAAGLSTPPRTAPVGGRSADKIE